MGDRPWIPFDEFVESLRVDGSGVVVNGAPEEVLLYPRLGSGAVFGMALAFWRWRRAARWRLRAAAVDTILVWDEAIAALCCLAVPRGVTVDWIAGEPEGQRAYQRARRWFVTRNTRRVEFPFDDTTSRRDGTTVDGWVVFGSERDVPARTLRRLRARAEERPALALVFDARRHDEVMPATLAALVEACDPQSVWWVGGDEWIRRLGGLPDEAVDPAFSGTPDHRHLTMRDRWRAL